MKLFKLITVVSAVLVLSVAVFAQDPVKVDPSHYSVLLENAAVRLLHVTYPVGGKSPMHQHPDSIAVALTPSKVKFTMPDGKTQDSDMANESAMYIPGGPHSPTNVGTGAVSALVVEFKAAAPGKATLPASRGHDAEGPGGRAARDGVSQHRGADLHRSCRHEARL